MFYWCIFDKPNRSIQIDEFRLLQINPNLNTLLLRVNLNFDALVAVIEMER